MTRIYVLAKDLHYDSKVLVEVAKLAGITGKGSALASLNEDEENRIRSFVAANPEAVGRMQAELRKLEEEQKRLRQAADPADANEEDICLGASTKALPDRDEVIDSVVDRSTSSLINAVSSDMFRGFEHFAVIGLGAAFEMILSQLDGDLDSTGLGSAIRRNRHSDVLTFRLTQRLIAANRTRNRIVHRRAGRFPTQEEIAEAKQAFAVGIIDLHKRYRHRGGLIEPLADSNPEVLNVLDDFFGLDD